MTRNVADEQVSARLERQGHVPALARRDALDFAHDRTLGLQSFVVLYRECAPGATNDDELVLDGPCVADRERDLACGDRLRLERNAELAELRLNEGALARLRMGAA